MFRLLILICLAPFLTAFCPPGFITESGFNKCYKFINDPQPFIIAEEKCQQLGGNLVAIANGFENNYVTGYVAGANSGKYWIGANLLTARSWAWTSGDSFIYTNWGPNTGSDPSPQQCVSITEVDTYWRKEICNTALPFVCQMNPNSPSTSSTCPPPLLQPTCQPNSCSYTSVCDYGYKLFHGDCKCYKTFFGPYKYNQSIAYCAQDGAHLPYIFSQDTNDYIVSLYQGEFDYDLESFLPWIGLICPNSNQRNCYWLDGTPLTGYTNFQAGQPEGFLSSEVYIELTDSPFFDEEKGKWSTPENPSGEGQVICQKDPYPDYETANRIRKPPLQTVTRGVRKSIESSNHPRKH